MKALLSSFFLLFLLVSVPARAVEIVENHAKGELITLIGAQTDGTPPIDWQWFKDGTPIAGATASVFTFTVDASSPGRYTVTASNSAGSASSIDVFVLSVTVPPSPPTIKVSAKKPGDVTVSVPKGTRVVVQP